MTAKRKFKSDAFEAIHSSATALLEVGAIDKTTMRDFDESCLTKPPEIDSEDIKKIRAITIRARGVRWVWCNDSTGRGLAWLFLPVGVSHFIKVKFTKPLPAYALRCQ